MTSNEFWFDDPKLIESYHIFYINRLKAEDMRDYKLGIYFLKAIDTTISNMFKTAGEPPSKYFEKPLLSNLGKTEKEIQEEEQQELKEKIMSRSKEVSKMIEEKKEERRQ